MTQARIKNVQCSSAAGLHRMAYKEWGDPANPRVLVCVHGVTRVGDDFDQLAQALSDHYRVVCPDVVGRGRSERLRNPELYSVPQYVADMVTLVARVTAVDGGASGVHWFGTSMGGLIGMVLAALPDSPIRKLVLNDIGPIIDPGALRRIGDYIGQDLRFQSFDEGARFVREVSASFGPHSDDEWTKLAADVLRQDADGRWVRHYDMGLALPFRAATPEKAAGDEAALWAAYDAIRCPTLLVRGAESDLLSHATALNMAGRGPRPQLVEIPNVGHAPTFIHDDQIAIARQFLIGGTPAFEHPRTLRKEPWKSHDCT
jgi:pimeloyl-ACP methyl ester carboxylesterase